MKLKHGGYGNKANNLSLLVQEGFLVPNGYSISEPDQYKPILKFPLAVRSSGYAEDSETESKAGYYKSFLNVDENEIEEKIEECFLHGEERFGVLIQEMVHPKYSGVTITDLDGSIVIEVVNGLCDKLTAGTINPDHYRIDRSTKEIQFSIKELVPELDLKEIITTCLKIENLYHGKPQDIEWSVDRDNRLWILQTRPVVNG